MLKIIGCFVDAHDHRLVALAALVCALASFTAVQLLCHAQRCRGGLRSVWLTIAAVACGSGIWATHFIAMLAYLPGVPSGYDINLTLLSLVYAIILTGCGLAVALWPGLPFAAWTGGAIVGGGIVAMHLTGMAALGVAGRIFWDPWTIAVAIVLSTALTTVALPLALGPGSKTRQFAAAMLLMVSICGHHFIAIGGLAILPDSSIDVAATSEPISDLAFSVALASFAILLSAGAALAIDLRDRRRAAIEAERLRSLADAAVEGIVVCRGNQIISANESFAQLVACSASSLAGQHLSTYLPADTSTRAIASTEGRHFEAELTTQDGTLIPVELLVRTIDYGKESHHAFAVRDIRARRKAERQIQFLAHHDGLTGLANRTSFNERLDRDMQETDSRGGKLAVLCLDLDRFKEVNDLFGHAAGDKLLQDVARVVTEVLGEDQMMSRLGGDEFAVLAVVEHAAAAGQLAERILEALRLESGNCAGPMIATSIGIALYPDHAKERALLLNFADTALYRAKSEGRGTYRFYQNRMGVEVRDRRLIEHDLRHAIARGEISLVYQPQTRVGSGQVIGFEALMRWQHRERGYVSPTTFIPIAEETGLILQLGEWALREACREAASWAVPLTIAVNVSGIQILGPHFVSLLHEILFKTGLQPDRLEIEITETAVIRDPARAMLTLRQVKTLGVRIAMDDFGTGYSSLSNLRQFPFDKIKIDGSFIKAVDSNEQTAAIVRSVLGLGRGLGLPVLAEGVETDRELAFLRGEDCHEAQGYLLGRPAPIETFAAYTGLLQPPEPKQALVA